MKTEERLLNLIQVSGEMTLSEIAEKLDIHLDTVGRIVKKFVLENSLIIRKVRQSRSFITYVSSNLNTSERQNLSGIELLEKELDDLKSPNSCSLVELNNNIYKKGVEGKNDRVEFSLIEKKVQAENQLNQINEKEDLSVGENIEKEVSKKCSFEETEFFENQYKELSNNVNFQNFFKKDNNKLRDIDYDSFFNKNHIIDKNNMEDSKDRVEFQPDRQKVQPDQIEENKELPNSANKEESTDNNIKSVENLISKSSDAKIQDDRKYDLEVLKKKYVDPTYFFGKNLLEELEIRSSYDDAKLRGWLKKWLEQWKKAPGVNDILRFYPTVNWYFMMDILIVLNTFNISNFDEFETILFNLKDGFKNSIGDSKDRVEFQPDRQKVQPDQIEENKDLTNSIEKELPKDIERSLITKMNQRLRRGKARL